MEAIVLLLAVTGAIAALTLKGLSSKDRAGITFLAGLICAVAIFALVADDWELRATWVALAAAPLLGAVVQHYKSRSRREA